MSDKKNIKILIVGENNTGKSSLLKKIVKRKFTPKLNIPTFGVNYDSKKYKNIIIDFWDISGSMEYISLFEIYLFETDIVFLCFDVTDIETLIALENFWIPETIQKKNSNKPTKIYLIGTKTDLQYDRDGICNKIHILQKKFKNIDYFLFSNKKEIFNLPKIIDPYCKSNNILLTKQKNSITFIEKIKNLFKK